MSQMTQTLTTTPPTDDLIVPFHCDRCGAPAKVRVVLASGILHQLDAIRSGLLLASSRRRRNGRALQRLGSGVRTKT